jgi:mercuric ion transport protein
MRMMTKDDRAEAVVALKARRTGATLFTLGGIVAGLAAASCCVVPFLFFLAGISGAWISTLTALEPYRPFFAAMSIGSVGYGLIRVYRPAATACAEDSPCAAPATDRLAKIGLWSAAAFVVLALASPYVIALWL